MSGDENRPVPMSKDTLVMVLKDILELVEKDDSFEGSLEYLMPSPPADHEVTVEPIKHTEITIAGEILYTWQRCTVCGISCPTEAELVEAHQGDPETTEFGGRTDFMVRAAYRTGNSMGQGGMTIIGTVNG